MILTFFKYEGAGNDFIMIDNRNGAIQLSIEQIEKLCDRHFGIGADGLILLSLHPDFDYQMVYYNSDGRESSMCGNGGRCITAFAAFLGIVPEKHRFLAIDGAHEAFINTDGSISLRMSDVKAPEAIIEKKAFVLNTGSPHYVCFKKTVRTINVKKEGAAIRYSPPFEENGINVNFVGIERTSLYVRTYERGVEDETLACGTGVTAAALVSGLPSPVQVSTLGGALSVSYESLSNGGFTNIWLKGPATFVFKGEIDI
jgi:diaminopimelate epimerase